ncbi:MAG: polyprenyl synthetase family protein [Lachnospiraceae bacterium]|nr:polyprenyl synthetase family protein [Lachnospiraceae bacterium]MDD3659111.1 polyprenyl synthetase family protein [Lachnospiraceae bacterium]
MNFKTELENRILYLEENLKRYLPEEAGYSRTVREAMNYSLLAGGKRIRPMLMFEVYQLFQGTSELIYPFMAAIEMIHTYSLVHDDLPSMDNDLYRRGKKTTHAVFGEGMAVLAGDGLLNYAFETVLKAKIDTDEMGICLCSLNVLAKKAGIDGMIGGQTADILAENIGDSVDLEHLLFIHKNKTAALIEASMMIGAILAGATDDEVNKMEQIANKIGIAFQIQDDILDITSTLEVLGKETGSDDKNNKVTYVTLNGLENSKLQVKKLSDEGIDILKSIETHNGYNNLFLNELLCSMIAREK